MRKPSAKTNTVYTHIWRSMAAMVAVVFLIAGAAIILYVRDTTTAEIEDQEHSYLAEVDNLIAHQLTSSRQILNMLVSNPFIVQSIHTGNREWNSDVYWSGQIIVNAINSNQIYNSIYVIAGDEVAIKSSRRYQSPEAEERIILSMRTQFRQSLIPWRSEVGSRTDYNLMMLAALEAVSTPNEIGGAILNLDLNRLADVAFANHGNREIALVMDDQIIASSRSEIFFTDLSAHSLLREAAGKPDGVYRGQYVCSWINSTYGYTLYALQDYASLMAPVNRGLTLLLAIISLLILLALLVARQMARHAYVPVKTILIELEEKLPAGQESDDEDLSDVQRVSRSIRRTSEIVSAYRRDVETIRLGRFIHSGTPETGIADLLEKTLGCQPEQNLYLLLFQADAPEDARMAADVLQGAMNGLARFLTLDVPGQRLLSLITALRPSSEEEALIVRNVEQVLRLMEAQGSGRVVVSLQRTRVSPEALHPAYIQLDNCLRSHVFCAGNTLLTDPEEDSISPSVLQHVYQAALQPDPEPYLQAARTFLASCRFIPAREAYHQLATLCMRISEAASSRNMDLSDRLDAYRTHLNALFTLSDYEAVMAYLQDLRQEAMLQASRRKAGENNPLTDRVLSYVKSHFDDPGLSAAQAADSLGVSVSHLSRTINKSLGCGFPEMLQKIRLEYAATQLMAKPGISIADLAQQCGFSSASYFAASFKKVYGVTPSNYRLKQAEILDPATLDT